MFDWNLLNLFWNQSIINKYNNKLHDARNMLCERKNFITKL